MSHVIYHSRDFDGIFCREVARYFLPANTVFHGYHYGDPTPAVPDDATLYILDVHVPALMAHPGLIWIDHHRTAMAAYPEHLPGYRIDGVAACRLAYQWFYHNGAKAGRKLPLLHQYGIPIKDSEGKVIGRSGTDIYEPLAIELAGRYDIWDKINPDVDTFQFGLRSREIKPEEWHQMIAGKVSIVHELLKAGRAIENYQRGQDAEIARHQAFTLKWQGLTFCALNIARCNSLAFTAGIKPEHEALLGFKWAGDHWEVSLRHAPGHEHHDLSALVTGFEHNGVKGGGHPGSCGFSCRELPFQLLQ
jgi:hypothetical protein